MNITLTDVGDPHVHFRQDGRMKDEVWQETQLLTFSVPKTAMWASFALPMPNTQPSIRTGEDAVTYARAIDEANPFPPMHIIKCIKAVENVTTPKIIYNAKDCGVDAIKVYFEGVTTNAEVGDAVSWDGFFKMYDVWKTCEEVDMVVCIHAEKPGVFSLEREYEAHGAIVWLSEQFPKLRTCAEHVTDQRTIKLIKRLPPNVVCTITGHHLWGDLDMVIGGHLNTHAYCKPTAKLPKDVKALRKAMMSGNPKFMFGSDTAPHPLEDKECEGCAGCFTGPYCLQIVAHILEEEGCEVSEIEKIMQGFMGDFARGFYRVPTLGKVVVLERKPFHIADIMHTSSKVPVVPFMASKKLNWDIRA